MKKIVSILIISLLLVSCGAKTNFDDLPKEEQTKIQNEVKGIVFGKMGEMVKIAFDFNMSDSEKDKEIDKITTQTKAELKTYLDKNYPNIEFNYDELMKKDNSKEEVKKEEIKKEYKKVKLGDFITMTGANDEGQVKLKISDIIWSGKEIVVDQWETKKATNEFLKIKFEGENIGKVPTNTWLSYAKLITKDGFIYKIKDTMQINKTQKGYGGCLDCEMNPGDKEEEYILFDIKKIDLTGAKIRFEDDLIDFEL